MNTSVVDIDSWESEKSLYATETDNEWAPSYETTSEYLYLDSDVLFAVV